MPTWVFAFSPPIPATYSTARTTVSPRKLCPESRFKHVFPISPNTLKTPTLTGLCSMRPAFTTRTLQLQPLPGGLSPGHGLTPPDNEISPLLKNRNSVVEIVDRVAQCRAPMENRPAAPGKSSFSNLEYYPKGDS